MPSASSARPSGPHDGGGRLAPKLVVRCDRARSLDCLCMAGGENEFSPKTRRADCGSAGAKRAAIRRCPLENLVKNSRGAARALMEPNRSLGDFDCIRIGDRRHGA